MGFRVQGFGVCRGGVGYRVSGCRAGCLYLLLLGRITIGEYSKI